MEPIFRRALRTLLEANLQRAAHEQYTLLDVTLLLTNGAFRMTVLKQVVDRDLHRYWLDEFAHYHDRERENWIQPVINKIAAFNGPSLRNVVGQQECKVDLAPLVEHNAPLIVDTDAGRLGVATAGLIGATILEQLACLLRERGEGRSRVLIVVDEFQLTPADWAMYVEGLRKFGGSFVLATQSLAALERTQPGLRGAVFGNQATIVCYRVSAEDARYLTAELDEAVERTDLINLGMRQAYVKTTDGAERLPTFSLEVPLLPAGDPAVASSVMDRSARLWGTPRAVVEAAYQQYLYRLYMQPDTGNGADTSTWAPAGVPAQGAGMPLAGSPTPPTAGSTTAPATATAAPPSAATTPVPTSSPCTGTSAVPAAPAATPSAGQAAHANAGPRGSAPRKHTRSRNAPRGGSTEQASLFSGVVAAGKEQTS
jgi:hypothetical protein